MTCVHCDAWRRMFLCLFITLAFSQAAGTQTTMDDFTYGPRLEFGINGAGLQFGSRPGWSSKYALTGGIYMSYRILYGLTFLGGMSFGIGSPPGSDTINYGPHYQINTDKGGYSEGTWIGARYDLPLNLIHKQIYNIHTVYIAGGAIWNSYGIRSDKQKYYPDGWESGTEGEPRMENRWYRVADMSGYFVALAARWRFDTINTEVRGSWIGSYGLDIGVRYTRYSDCEPARDTIETAGSNFNNFQIFIAGSLKLRLLY